MPTRFGAHAFIWESQWTPDAARHVIEQAAGVGLDFVEIPLLRPESFDASQARQLLDENGIEATCSLGLPEDASLPENPEAAEDVLMQVLDHAAELRSPVVTGVIYGTLGSLVGRPPEERDYEVIASTLGRVSRHAASLGISLGLEPVNRYESYLVNLTSQALDLVERIDEPNVFVHLDTYHMNIEERGMKAPIVRAGNRLRYIHLSESDRGIPGEGNVDWDQVFSGLAEVGYEGDLVMESFVALNPDIARATCIWRPVVDDPYRLVTDGLSFLRGKAQDYGLLG